MSWKQKGKPNWKRKLTKQEKTNCEKIKTKIQKKKNQKTLTTSLLLELLQSTRNFIGVYAEDELKSITISSFPSLLVCNTDSHSLPGSHWIALGVFRDTVEIFDPSGFRLFLLPRIPCHLLNFIHKLSVTRTVRISNRVQSNSSTMCGFYCMFYVLARNSLSLKKIQSFFSSRLARNDSILKTLFYLY